MQIRQLIFIACTTLIGCVANAQVGNNLGLLDANLADTDELAALPGMSSSLVDSVVAGRPFRSASDLDAAIGDALGDEAKAALYGKMFRQINLNTASRDEIMLIPGMSGRMAHEFEEYRPYTSMDQFRREIGKYVDDEEVARLEQYVFVPINLNTASEDTIKTIPGMSRKMVHEFEEYRPYTSMEQFRREIGKYVDEDEVARLESYVTLGE